MTRYLIKRIINVIPVFILGTIIAFTIIHMAPGGPEDYFLGSEQKSDINVEQVAQLRAKWGLNDPLPVQYLRWLKNTVGGDFGYSYFQRRPVSQIIGEALPNTIELNAIVLVLIYGIALPLGVISAVRQYSKFDYIVTGMAFIGQAAPIFWVAMLLQYGVALHSGGFIPTNGIATAGIDFSTYGWLSVLGDRFRYLLLPVTAATFTGLTGLTRYMRSSMLEVLKEDYTRTARAKGLSERVVIYKHAMRNALISIVTVSGYILVELVGGSVILETIFSWPGIGRVGFDAVIARDYPVTMGILVMGMVLAIVSSLLMDVAYVFVDPRIKYD